MLWFKRIQMKLLYCLVSIPCVSFVFQAVLFPWGIGYWLLDKMLPSMLLTILDWSKYSISSCASGAIPFVLRLSDCCHYLPVIKEERQLLGDRIRESNTALFSLSFHRNVQHSGQLYMSPNVNACNVFHFIFQNKDEENLKFVHLMEKIKKEGLNLL